MNKLLIMLAFLITSFSYGAAQTAATPVASQIDAARMAAQQALEQQTLSLNKQRQSVHQQLGKPLDTIGIPIADFIAPMAATLQTPCPALDPDDVSILVDEAARKQALSPDLLRAVMKQESAFKPCAVSLRGAQGLMQLMPATVQQLHVSDPFDPMQNVQAGASFLKQLLTRYKGDLKLALAAYNAGPVRADQQATRPFPIETQNYLANIFADLDVFPKSANGPEEPGRQVILERVPDKPTSSAAETVEPQF